MWARNLIIGFSGSSLSPTQNVALEEKSSKADRENRFMAEALEDLQHSNSRLEAENRALRNRASAKEVSALRVAHNDVLPTRGADGAELVGEASVLNSGCPHQERTRPLDGIRHAGSRNCPLPNVLPLSCSLHRISCCGHR